MSALPLEVVGQVFWRDSNRVAHADVDELTEFAEPINDR